MCEQNKYKAKKTNYHKMGSAQTRSSKCFTAIVGLRHQVLASFISNMHVRFKFWISGFAAAAVLGEHALSFYKLLQTRISYCF